MGNLELRALVVLFGITIPLSASADSKPIKPTVVDQATHALITDFAYTCPGGPTLVAQGKFKNTGSAATKYSVTIHYACQGACLKTEKAPSTCQGFCPDRCVQYGPDTHKESDLAPQTLAPGASVTVSGPVPADAAKLKSSRLEIVEAGKTAVVKAIGPGSPCIQ